VLFILLLSGVMCPVQLYNVSAYRLFLFERSLVNLTYDASSSSNCSYLQNLLRDEVMYLARLHLFHGVKLRLIPWSATGAEKRLLNYDIEYLIEMEKAFNNTCSGACTSRYFTLYTMLLKFRSINTEASTLINYTPIKVVTAWSNEFIRELSIFNPSAPLPSTDQVIREINDMINYLNSEKSLLGN